jgi:ABC-type molybdate transport system ATPase subunit
MKGKYEILVKDMHLQYKFTITRNITILRGDSATGKTTLIDMIAAYQQNRERSGVTLRSV